MYYVKVMPMLFMKNKRRKERVPDHTLPKLSQKRIRKLILKAQEGRSILEMWVYNKSQPLKKGREGKMSDNYT